MIYNPAVLPIKTLRPLCLLIAGCSIALHGQTAPTKPQVRVNYINPCSPSEAEQQEIAAALGRIPAQPSFSADIEIARGRSTMNPSDLALIGAGSNEAAASAPSNWVRIRRDLPEKSTVSNAQYSFSTAESRVTETLVLHFRDAKDVLQVSLSDAVNAASDPASVARLNTPVDRIRIERFGKSSIVLSRCQNQPQEKFEPLFARANDLMTRYRRALNVPGTVPAELARIPGAPKPRVASGTRAR